jgi:hypothetical protein
MSVVVGYILYKINTKFQIKNSLSKIVVLLISFAYILSPFSFIVRFSKICYRTVHDSNGKKSHRELFRELTGTDYVERGKIKVKLPSRVKNLVIIEMESFEQRFLDNFSENTKDIVAYSEEGEFYSDITMVEGSGWTIAGIHTFLCGSPLIYNLKDVALLKIVSISKLVCLPDILKRAGYHQMYIGGERRTFSGKSQFFFSHGYDEVLGKKELRKEYNLDKENFSDWGIRDREIFEIAKDKYRKLSQSKKPFSLMLSTLDAHSFDGGLRDDRCRNTTENKMLNSIECTSDLVADFISFLENEPNYEDTLVVILPDHLAMGDFPSIGIGAGDSGRKLYVILLNSGARGRKAGALLYSDVPSLILKRMNLEHNAKFLLENHRNQDQRERIKYIDENLDKIRLFNSRTLMHE